MNQIAEKIHVGRVVHFFAGYGGIDGKGAIVAVHGTPNPAPPQSILGGVGRVIRRNDCTVDVILFDGRRLNGKHQCGIDAPGIGIKLTDETVDAETLAALPAKAAAREADEGLARVVARQRFEAREAARVITDAPVFYWNGIKDAKGEKLQKCWYIDMGAHGSVTAKFPPHTITIYARDYGRFSAKVAACFAVENDSDGQVDYFEADRIRVIPTHPLYPQVRAAMEAGQARAARRK